MSFRDTLKSLVTFSDADLAPIRPDVLDAVGPSDAYAVAASQLPPLSWQFGKPSWPTWDPYAGATAYARLALIYRCVNIVAHALGTAPVIVTDDANDAEPLPDHPLTQLMKRPNAYQGAASFWSHVAVRTATSGFCVIEKERDRLGTVIGLHPLISAYLKAKPRRDSRHDWEYRIPGIVEPFPLDADDVLVFRWADTPSGSPYGMGPLEACLREVGLNNALIDFVKLYVERGAAPMFALIPADNAPPLDQTQADALLDGFVARRMGLHNAVRPAYLGPIKDLKVIGNNLEEMAYTALRDMNELGIVQAFGIPASVAQIRVGLEHSDSRANAEVDEAKLYRQTIIPLWTRFDDALTLGLLSEYPDSERKSLNFDTSDIDALQEDRNAKAVWANAAVTGGHMSVHTWHRELGLKIPPGPDYFLRSIALEAIPVTEPIPPKEPPPPALQPGQEPDDGEEELSAYGLDYDRLKRAIHADVQRIAGLTATTQSTGYRRRYARAQSGRALIAKIAAARQPSLSRFFAAQGRRILPTLTERLAATEITLTPEIERDVHRMGPVFTSSPIYEWRVRSVYALQDVDWQREEDELERILKQLYALAGDTAYEAVNAEVGASLSFDLANPNLGNVRDLLAQRVTRITEESRFAIQETITTALQEGTDIAGLRDRLTALFDGWSTARAETVARTESMSSFGYASAAGYRESGVVDRIQCFDNPTHSEPYKGAEDGLSCASRNGHIAPLEDAELHIRSEHPNGSLAIAGVLIGEDV